MNKDSYTYLWKTNWKNFLRNPLKILCRKCRELFKTNYCLGNATRTSLGQTCLLYRWGHIWPLRPQKAYKSLENLPQELIKTTLEEFLIFFESISEEFHARICEETSGGIIFLRNSKEFQGCIYAENSNRIPRKSVITV